MTERKAAGSPLRHESFVGDPEPGDGQAGDWSREHLIEMDRQFRQRIERSIASGEEHAPAKPSRVSFLAGARRTTPPACSASAGSRLGLT
jgi:hypothetical protein